jgi:Dolichyl-phosphate-mannose-protein mannosyltransferase
MAGELRLRSWYCYVKQIPALIAILLLALMAVLSGGAARRESIAFDEAAHIGAGVSYLQKLDMRMNPEHPPLAKVLAAIPLVMRGVNADYSDVSWSFSGRGFGNMLGEWSWGHSMAVSWNDRDSTLMWARAPMLLLTLILGIFAYQYAAQLGGPWGGLLCVAVYASTPAFLVFGPLVLTDVAVTLFVLLALWSFAELWRAPSRATLLPFGLLLGAAFLTKFSSGFLLFAFLAFRLSLRWLPLPGMPEDRLELRAWRRLRGRYLWKGILLSAVTVYVVYLVLSWNQSTDALQFLGHGNAAMVARRLLMPIFIYFRGLALFALGSNRSTFLLGHFYTHGVWFFFPIIFLFKSTLAFLLMLALAIPISLVARKKVAAAGVVPAEKRFHWRAVWVFLLVFMVFCMLSRMTISIRHFTIPIVLLILLLAPVPSALALLAKNGWASARPVMVVYAVLSMCSVVAMVRQYPYLFPFVNSLGFGRPAFTLVSDSNLDWNQSLPEVEKYVQQHGLSHVLLDQFGMNDPNVYVPQAQFWNCQSPSPSDGGQWAVVSADMIEDAHNCVWLLHYPSEAIAAGSMYVFQLPAVIPPVGDPGGPPPASDFHFMAIPSPDGSDLRLTFLKCLRDPNQLQPTMDHMMAVYEAEQAKRRAQRDK